MTQRRTVTDLVRDVGVHGGVVLCDRDCSPSEVEAAQRHGRYAVDDDGLGYVRQPEQWLQRLRRLEAK